MSAFWAKWIPASLENRLLARPGFQRILHNTGWLLIDRVLRLGLGLLIYIWIARYLGPDKLGTLSYAIALTTLFGIIAKGGMDNILIREIVKEPESTGDILGTGFLLKLVGAVISLFLVLVCVRYLRPDDWLSFSLVATIGTGIIFQSLEVIRFWFESQVQSKYVVITGSLAFILVVGVKIALILLKAPLVAFAWAVLSEIVLAGFFLVAVYYYKGGRIGVWCYTGSRARQLLKDGWPLILTAIIATVYLRIDQVMLGDMVDDHSVGLYSVAARISEVWYFLPTVIISSIFPSIVRSRNQDRTVYLERLRLLYEFLFMLAVLVALTITFCSDWIIQLFFGDSYKSASPILAIMIWAGVAVFMGGASYQYLVVENLTRNSFYRTLIGAVVNVALNLLWIPRYGATGAAYATLVSYCVAVYSLVMLRNTHEHAMMMIKASLPLALLGRMLR